MNPALRHFLRRPWLRELLVVALLFKALIPAGYMPDVGSDGLPSLKLCSYSVSLAAPATGGAGPGSAGDSGSGDDASDHAVQGVCPQALSLLPVVAPAFVVAVAPLTLPLRRARVETDSLRFYRSPTPHSRLPRGPPAHV